MKRISVALLAAFVIAVVAWFVSRTGAEPTAAVARSEGGASARAGELLAPAADAVTDARSPTTPAETAVGAATPSAAPPPALIVRGEVVDERRMPVARADVSLRFDDQPARTVLSAADGAFEFAFAARPSGRGATARAWARVGSTSAGFRSAWVAGQGADRTASGFRVPSANAREVDLGSIALLPAYPLRVSVLDAGQPVAGARVLADIEPLIEDVLEATTDASGVADLPPLPETMLRLRATIAGKEGRATAFLPHQSTAVIELAPVQEIELLVIDAANGAAIAGAQIELGELVQMPAALVHDPENWSSAGDAWAERLRSDWSVTSDEHGRARLRFPSGIRPRLRVSASGYQKFPARSQKPPPLDQPGTEARVEMLALGARTVRWPIIDGEVPAPRDGSSVKLRIAAGTVLPGDMPEPPPPGRMEGATLVVDGVELWQYLAEAEDGALAMLRIGDESTEGKPTAFRRGRRIEVLVRDELRAPVEGVAVNARNQGNNALCDWVLTDAEGRAWLTGLYGGLADVYVARRGEIGIGANAGSVDLDAGDGRVEYVLTPLSTALVRTWIDGVPRLPPKLSVYSEPRCRIVDELPEQALLRIELAARPGESKHCVLSALGFLGESFEATAGASGAEAIVDVHLRRAGKLIATVALPADGGLKLTAERWNAESGKWPDAATPRDVRSTPNGPDGSFVFAGCEHGRWRVRDLTTALTSDEVDITAFALDARVHLDLASVQWVSGRVEAPAGVELKLVRVLVEGDAPHAQEASWMPGGEAPRGATLAKDGSFRVRVPGDRTVLVRPWHPWLSPADEGGSLSTRSGREGVVLRLEAGNEVRLPVPQLASLRNLTGVRVALYRGSAVGEPERWLHAPIADGVARFGGVEPGRWTLWIDPTRDFAPLALEQVEIAAGITELAPARFEAGASIRVRVLVADGQTPPRVYANARRRSAPAYFRSASSDGTAELVVAGFDRGTFEVALRRVMDFGAPGEPRLVELDGQRELVLELDLRQ